MNKLVLFIIGVLIVAGLSQSVKPKPHVPTQPAPSSQSASIEQPIPSPPAPSRPTVPMVKVIVPPPERSAKAAPPAATGQPPVTESSTESVTDIIDSHDIGQPIESRTKDLSPVTQAATSQQFFVNTQRLNVRAEASAKAAKIGELVQGEEIASLYDEDVDGWAHITAHGGELQGWVNKSFLAKIVQ